MTAVGGRSAVRRIALARLVDVTGSGAAFAALAFIMFQLTGGSASWVSWTLLLTIGVQGFVQPLASWLGDRFDRRRVLVVSSLLAAAGFGAMMVARSPSQLLALACLTAIVEAPILSVASSVIPNLVGDEDLSWANGRVALGRNVGSLLGPIVGGALVAVLAPGDDPSVAQLHAAGALVFGTNAVSFLASAWIVGRTEGRFSELPSDEPGDRSVRAGVRFVLADPVLRAVTFGWVALVLGAGLILVAEVGLADLFDQGSLGYGILTAVSGGGAAGGAVLAGRYLNARREGISLIATIAVGGVAMFVVALSPWWTLVLALMLVAGLAEGWSGVAEQGVLQRRTPDDLRSRVNGFVEACVLLAFGVSFLIGGPIVDGLGPRSAYLIGAAAAVAALFVMAPAVRQLSRAGDGGEGVAVGTVAGVTDGTTTGRRTDDPEPAFNPSPTGAA
jgi:MFS family permease